MNKETVYRLLSGSMNNIYAYCLSRLSNKTDAEDLANDIILAVISSHERIRNDEAFYGYMWATANNLYKKRLRKMSRDVPIDANFIGINYDTPEDICVDTEELMLLRRELSLLSERYRRVTVGFYIENKSTARIAEEMSLSPENVRYILYKVRKILREGIDMERNYGVQSYQPRVFALEDIGKFSNMSPLFERKLPGNIMFAAYEEPVTAQHISMELGVAMPYLEDELKILAENALISEQGGKYASNLVILTREYERAAADMSRKMLDKTADELYGALAPLVDEVNKLEFTGCERTRERLLWLLAFRALYIAFVREAEAVEYYARDMPKWPDGSETFLFAHDNMYEYQRFYNVLGYWRNRKNTAYITVMNYKIFERCQKFNPYWNIPPYENVKGGDVYEILCDVFTGNPVDEKDLKLIKLIDNGVIISENGKLSANFPVFEKSEERRLDAMLEESALKIVHDVTKVSDKAAELIRGYAPKRLKKEADIIARVYASSNAIGHIMDLLVEKGYLEMPEGKANLGMMGTVREK